MPGPDSSREPPADEKLESWKEIARYLRRTVRTAHRWEKEEGLPVRRHLHQKQSTVYAYKSEIDAWRAARNEQAGKRRRGWLSGPRLALAAAVLAAGTAGLWIAGSRLEPGEPAAGQAPAAVAVLPFAALHAAEDDALLARGIAEEVLNRLSNLAAISVVSRTSAFAFEAAQDPVEVAERLGVDLVLAGSLERDDRSVRVRARLLDRDGRLVWSETFDHRPQGLFELQDEIATAVVASVAPSLAVTGPTRERPDPDAYRHFLLGREYLRLNDSASAIAAFKRAIEIAPTFARPYGDLALALALQSGRVMDRVSYAEARAAAEMALAIDPQLAEAHAALGIVAVEEGRPADADAALRRALALSPTLVTAYSWLSVNLETQGRYADSARVLERALELDPLNPDLNARLAAQHWARGDYEGARRLYVRILDLPKPPPAPYYMLVALNREFGRLEEALAWAQQAALEFPKFAGLNALIQTYARLEMQEEAETWIERLERVESDAAPRLGIHSEYLFTQGRFEEIYALKTEYLERSGMALSDLPFAAQETFGGVAILSGRYDEGIRTLEPWFGGDFRLPHHLGGSDFALTFAQFLAWGYLQSGDAEAAERLLDRIGWHLRDMHEAGVGNRPNLHVVEARNHALRGERKEALAALGTAVDMGWRDYVFERVNPVWSSLREDPGFEALMTSVRADVAAQRARIEARADAKAFEPAVLAKLGL